MFTAPVNISIIGHDAGLDIDISRVMGAWIDETGYEPLAHFPAIYEQVLQVLVEPRYSIVDTESDSTLTFSDIQRRIHSMVKGEWFRHPELYRILVIKAQKAKRNKDNDEWRTYARRDEGRVRIAASKWVMSMKGPEV
jgi:hypothetical protein